MPNTSNLTFLKVVWQKKFVTVLALFLSLAVTFRAIDSLWNVQCFSTQCDCAGAMSFAILKKSAVIFALFDRDFRLALSTTLPAVNNSLQICHIPIANHVNMSLPFDLHTAGHLAIDHLTGRKH